MLRASAQPPPGQILRVKAIVEGAGAEHGRHKISSGACSLVGQPDEAGGSHPRRRSPRRAVSLALIMRGPFFSAAPEIARPQWRYRSVPDRGGIPAGRRGPTMGPAAPPPPRDSSGMRRCPSFPPSCARVARLGPARPRARARRARLRPAPCRHRARRHHQGARPDRGRGRGLGVGMDVGLGRGGSAERRSCAASGAGFDGREVPRARQIEERIANLEAGPATLPLGPGGRTAHRPRPGGGTAPFSSPTLIGRPRRHHDEGLDRPIRLPEPRPAVGLYNPAALPATQDASRPSADAHLPGIGGSPGADPVPTETRREQPFSG